MEVYNLTIKPEYIADPFVDASLTLLANQGQVYSQEGVESIRYSNLTPDANGEIVLQIPPTQHFSTPTFYQLLVNGVIYNFAMPAKNSYLHDLLRNKIKDLPWHIGTNPPLNPVVGDSWFNPSTGLLSLWNGGEWQTSPQTGDAIVIRGTGNPQGDKIATATLPTGAVRFTWSTMEDGYEADNGDEGDTDPALLKRALEATDSLPDGQIGWIVRAYYDNTPFGATLFLAASDYDNYELGINGTDVITIQYSNRRDDAEGWIISNLDNPEGADVRIELYAWISNAMVGATQTEFNNLNTRVENELQVLRTQDMTLQGNIDNEAHDRRTSDNNLQEQITTEHNGRVLADSNIQASVTAEVNNRAAADVVLQGNISQEIADREAADNQLQASISALMGGDSDMINNAQIDARIVSWARAGSTADIPWVRIETIPDDTIETDMLQDESVTAAKLNADVSLITEAEVKQEIVPAAQVDNATLTLQQQATWRDRVNSAAKAIEALIEYDKDLLGATVTMNLPFGNAFYALPNTDNPDIPPNEPGASFTITVTSGGLQGIHKFALTDLYSKSEVGTLGDRPSTGNAIEFTVTNNVDTYIIYIGRRQGKFVIASDTVGVYQIGQIHDHSSMIRPFARHDTTTKIATDDIADEAITDDKLLEAVRTELWARLNNTDKIPDDKLNITVGRIKGVGALPLATNYDEGDVWVVIHQGFWEVVDSTGGQSATRTMDGLTAVETGSGDNRIYTFTIPVSGGNAELRADGDNIYLEGPTTLGIGSTFTLTVGDTEYTLTDEGNVASDAQFVYRAHASTWAFTTATSVSTITLTDNNAKIFTGVTGKTWSFMGLSGKGVVTSADAPLRLTDGRLDLPINHADSEADIDDDDRVMFANDEGDETFSASIADTQAKLDIQGIANTAVTANNTALNLKTMRFLTLAQYNAISQKDADTLYFIYAS